MLSGLYALSIVYTSDIIGPLGLHFVPIGLGEAWQKFTEMRFVAHASQERPDWVANMIMLTPLSFLFNSALGLGADERRRAINIAITTTACVVFILAVKYTQLFFPPRTVTLNYVAAQVTGTLIGIVLFQLSRTRLYPRLAALFENGDGLTIVLGAYTVWLFAYFLMPFDFVLSKGDLIARGLELITILGSAPGAARQPGHQFLVFIADILSTVPVGMFLAVRWRNSSFRSVAFRAFGMMVLITIMQLFVLGAEPFLIAPVYRTLGALVGIYAIHKIAGKDLRKRHYYFARFVPIAFPVYVLLVMFVSGLFTSQWWTSEEAVNALEPRQFLPFWNYYIVSKAHAAQSLVVEFFMFAPIGVMIWLRRGFWARGALFSATLAFGLSMLMEIGRLLKPGLRPDFSDPLIAALGAAVAFKAMPILWRMFEREAARSGSLDAYIADRQKRAAPNGRPATI